ncbi:MAG: nicotinate-nucleotide adenylyltransferase [Pseudomonadota bacterium]
MPVGSRRLRRPLATNRLHPPATARLVPSRLRIGVLGGSFNPAHDGHRHISTEALKQLGLDWVWWLVSPQNPLKSSRDTAPLAVRVARARNVARHPRILVTDLEARLGTRYTAETLPRLVIRHPRHRFVWLMGADNLATLHHWHRWPDILQSVPVAVFDREPYVLGALAGRAARRFAVARFDTEDLRSLVTAAPPAWGFVRLRPHPAASSAIRAAGAWGAPARTEER